MTIPTGTIDVYPTSLNAAQGATVYFTNFLSNVEADYINGLIQVEHGTLTGFSSELGGYRWSAYLQTTPGIEDSTNTIIYDYGSETVVSNNYVIDTVVPTLTSITWSDDDLGAGESAVLTVTFSEAMTSGPVADLEIARLNGAFGLSEFISSDGGVTWTATLTPYDRVDITLSVPIQVYTQDLAGNRLNDVSYTPEIHIDTKGPTWTASLSDTDLRPGETAEVTFTFSEAVTGFTKDDVIFPGGTLSDLTSSDGGVTWIAIFTPDANTASQENLIGLRGSGVTDLHGNAALSQFRWDSDYRVDTRQPTATITFDDANLKAGETTTVHVVFSHSVRGFGFDDITVENGTLTGTSEFMFGFGSTTFDFIFTPSENVTDATNAITINNAGVTVDRSGNTGVGTSASGNYAIDTMRPTATIAIADTTLGGGQSTAVTFTFSEAVSGFFNGDLSVENGTLSTVTSADGGKTWTAVFTATDGITDATNVITLDMTDISDLAGNSGTGSAASGNYEIVPNEAPTGVAMAGGSVSENAANKTEVGRLSATDADAGDTHTFTLLDNAGGRFAVSGNKIVVADSLGLDFEQAASHTITVRATDQGGKFYDQALTISLTNVTGETVYGDARDNTISSGAGADRLYGGLGTDRMTGGNGNDIYYADRASDTIVETSADRATGGYDSVMSSASYWLSANVEALFLGGTGAINGTGNGLGNAIGGNGAANVIDGGLGNDYLTGGAGRDTFRFSSALNAATNKDFITDFNAADDTIQLSVGAFRGLAVGDLNPNAFYAAAGAIKAYDASDRIVYNSTTGDLYFDADGLGGAAAIKFATLRGKPGLSAADFDIVGVD